MTRGSAQVAEEVRQAARYLFDLLTLLDAVRRHLNAPPEWDFPPAAG